MVRANADRPLTDAQERALIALADYRDEHPGGWSRLSIRLGTLEALRKRGLCEIRFHGWTEVALITEAGYALCRSMGD